MSSSDKPKTEEKGAKEPKTEEKDAKEQKTEQKEPKEGEDVGFLGKVKGFITSSSDKPKTEESGSKEPKTEEKDAKEPKTEGKGTKEPKTEEKEPKEGEDVGFLGKVKGFITSSFDKPKTEENGAKEPKKEESGTKEPKTEESGAKEPKTEESGPKEPKTEESGAKEPKTEEKGAKEPKTEEKGAKEPKTEEKGTKEPKTEEKEPKEGEDVGFLGKVKDFVTDIGEKIEDKVGVGRPTAELAGVHVPKINLKQADLIFDVLVANPNPVPIPLVDIKYLIDNDGRKLASGLIPDAGTIHAHGSETIQIPLTIIYDDIKKSYADIEPGSILPYKVKVDLIVDVPVIGKLTLPIEKTGEIPVPYRPDVHIEKINFERFSWEETVAILHLKLDNKNDFDLGLNKLEYEIWLCDVSIGGTELTKTAKILKNDISDLDIPLTFRPKDCGSALWDMIKGNGTGYSIKGHIDADTPFGQMKLPIEKEGGTTTFKKEQIDGEEDPPKDVEKGSA